MEELKKRNEIEIQDKWDLEDMYQDKNAIEEDIDKVKKYHQDLVNYKGKIMDNG